MVYSPKILKALRFAIKVHQIDQDQRRYTDNVPFIIHPLIAGLILAKADASEEVIIAGILHDTIEDSDPSHKVTKKMLEKQFGKKVAQMVDDITEHRPDLPWLERKAFDDEYLLSCTHDSLFVKSADVLQNTNDSIEEYKKDGNKMFERFPQTKKEYLQMYTHRIQWIAKAWQENPLLPDLKEVLKQLEILWK